MATISSPPPAPPPAAPDLAGLPELAGFLQALRGGPCPRCEGDGKAHGADRPFEYSGPGGWPGPCPVCKGSGRAPPDLAAAAQLADYLAERGAGDADVLRAVALPPEWRRPLAGLGRPSRCGETVHAGPDGLFVVVPPAEDDSLLPLLGEWDRVRAGFAPPGCPVCKGRGRVPLVEQRYGTDARRGWNPCDRCGGTGNAEAARRRARAAAARGLRVERWGPDWCVTEAYRGVTGPYPAEPAARLALKLHALALYADVKVPCRAEGRRLSLRGTGAEEFAVGLDRGGPWEGRPFVPYDLAYEYRLDGARVGGPPSWAWTPWRVWCECFPSRVGGEAPDPACPRCGGAGYRLVVTWDSSPEGLLPPDVRAGVRFNPEAWRVDAGGAPPGSRRP